MMANSYIDATIIIADAIKIDSHIISTLETCVSLLAMFKGTCAGLQSQKNRWFYFSLLIWPYDVNKSID